MNREDIYQAITDLEDDLVMQAGQELSAEEKGGEEETGKGEMGKGIRAAHGRRWGALAACLALAVVGLGTVLAVLPRFLGGGAGNTGSAENGDGGPGVNSSEAAPGTFMSYAGPVFPLTLREANSAVTGVRKVTLDFAPWISTWWSNEEEAASRTNLTDAQRQEVLAMYDEWYPEGGRWQSSNDVLVTDAYTLTNASESDQVLRILYPFAGSLYQLGKVRPVLAVDGIELETVLHAGAYAGGYEGVWRPTLTGNEMDDSSLNLDNPESWEDYRDALADGTYLENALKEYPDLSDTKIIVYEFQDPWSQEKDKEKDIPNPTLRAGFYLDYDKTIVLTTGFHGMSQDPDKGWMGQEFSIPQPGESRYGKDRFRFIVVGEDIRDLSIQGYATGGWESDKVIEAGATIHRYETDLEEVLRQAAREMFDQWEAQEAMSGVDFEMYFGLLKEWLISDGPLSDQGVDRYASGWLEENDVRTQDRVFWLEAEVTVPAGGSVEVTARMNKEASFDFYCAHTENQGISGYDLVTRLGSNLNCPTQTAVLEDRDQIEIVRQNFGFDPGNGVRTVPLTEEVYFLEVRRKADGGM